MPGKSKYKAEFRDGIFYKECADCHELKTASDFYPSKSRTLFGVTTLCKLCFNILNRKKYHADRKNQIQRVIDYQLKVKYNMTEADYNVMYTKQNGICLICNKHNEKLVIDHCHIKNNVRGLLCTLCNAALGQFRDNPSNTEMATRYLQDFQHD